MKFLVILSILLSPFVSSAQSTPEIEKALYEVNVKGQTAYYTDLRSTGATFTRDQFESFKEIAMNKEGVFDIQIIEDGKIIRVAHLSYVEAQTLKYFGTQVNEEIEVEQRQPYTF